MQARCQRCNYMFTLAREAVAAALEEVKETRAKHYNVECPKCRRQMSSGSFKICGVCSAQLGQCQLCLAPLKGQKPAAPPKAKLDLKKSGTFEVGKWKYVYKVRRLTGPRARATPSKLDRAGRPETTVIASLAGTVPQPG